MRNLLIYPVGCTPASHAAARHLAAAGLPLADHITPEATHLLMDVPSFSSAGILKSGASLDALLQLLPRDISLIGGNIPDSLSARVPSVDLLRDEEYLYENAALTAECALRAAGEKTNFAFRRAPVLVIGWGRIGRHLCTLLRQLGAEVSLLSRTAAHRAEAASFGITPISPEALPERLRKFRILFNTAPGMVLPAALCDRCGKCLKIDLASVPGMEGADVIPARGLPGIHAPESAGALIAGAVIRLVREGGR